jgi:hypothetical protein
MCLKVLLEDAARLDEQAAIDRLVRHLVSLIIGIGVLEPSRNLLRRPVLFQPGSDQLPQLFMHRQLARLRPKRSIPGPPVRDCGTIPSTTAIAPELAAHCRWRPPKTGGDRSQRHAYGNPARDLFPISKAQRTSRSSPRCRPDPAVRLEVRKDRSRRPVEHSTDQLQPFTPLPTIPNLCTLRRREQAAHPSLRHRSPHLALGKVLRQPPETTVESGHKEAAEEWAVGIFSSAGRSSSPA